MDGIKLAVTKLEPILKGTDDYIFYGILKREHKIAKNTLSEWKAIIEQLKNKQVI